MFKEIAKVIFTVNIGLLKRARELDACSIEILNLQYQALSLFPYIWVSASLVKIRLRITFLRDDHRSACFC